MPTLHIPDAAVPYAYPTVPDAAVPYAYPAHI